MDELQLDKLKKWFPKRKPSCLKNLLLLLMCVLKKETVSVYKWRGEIGACLERSGTKPESNYKRALRFFTTYAFGDLWIDLLIVCFSLLRLKADYLALDGTSWQHGKRKIHLLVLCVIYQGVAIPIYWENLSKKGTSNTGERTRLFTKAMEKFNLSNKTLLADREYIGVEWFKFLLANEIDFIIRLKKGAYKHEVNATTGRRYSALEKKVLRSTTYGKCVGKGFTLEGMGLRILMAKNTARDDKDAIIYLITNKVGPAKKLALAYFIRWKIEVCFKHMKSSGFQIESINFNCEYKTRLLLAITVFAYTLSVLEGLKDYQAIKKKKYRNGTTYKPVAVFRNGIDCLVAKCNYFKNLCQYLFELIDGNLKLFKSSKAIFVQ